MAQAWADALEAVGFTKIQDAIRARDVASLKSLWNKLVPMWDDRTFYDFIASSEAFSKLSFHHREVFGQVGFGTGGWDSDFPNSMLEIFRVVMTNCDEDQRLIVGGAEQVPRGLWEHAPSSLTHWPAGTSLASLHSGGTRPGVAQIAHADNGFEITDVWGVARRYPAVLVTCQGWLLTTQIRCDESLFSYKLWTALDRTRYMQSSKTFVMVDRPFWKDKDPKTGRDVMSTTLTDRLTRGTYLFDNGADKPAVICLTYSWMSDALKMLPHTVEHRVRLALSALKRSIPMSTSPATSSATRSRCPGRPMNTPSARSRVRYLDTTDTTSGCTRTSCRTTCPPISVAFSLRETTSRGPPPGSRARYKPR